MKFTVDAELAELEESCTVATGGNPGKYTREMSVRAAQAAHQGQGVASLTMAKKMLYFIVGAMNDTMQLAKPGVTDYERAQSLLTKLREQRPNRKFELLAIEQSNAPGWQALGDKMGDEALLETDFEG